MSTEQEKQVIGKIVEVADDARHLSAIRGFMLVEQTSGSRQELGRIPLDDIAAVVANAHGLSYTNNLLVALAQQGAPFVLCGANHCPISMLWPIEGNFEQSKRIDAQIAAGLPLRKRLWASLVKSKLEQQSAALEATGANPIPVRALAPQVKSGDPENLEAQGARRYWHLLFGDEFRRDQSAGGTNSQLNYGYTIARSAMARAVIAAGLHPGLGLHHANAGNAMRLVDDLIEPFRAVVDLQVWRLQRQGITEVTHQAKKQLVQTLFEDMSFSNGVSPVMASMHKLATSLAQVFLGTRNSLELPLPVPPLELGLVSQSQPQAR